MRVDAFCRSCHQRIWFVRSERGKPLPVDREPDPKGNLVLLGPDMGQAKVVTPGELPEMTRYMSHFATCPEAARFRNRVRR